MGWPCWFLGAAAWLCASAPSCYFGLFVRAADPAGARGSGGGLELSAVSGVSCSRFQPFLSTLTAGAALALALPLPGTGITDQSNIRLVINTSFG